LRVNRTPITVYDFFGYLLPGFLFLALCLFSYKGSYPLAEKFCGEGSSSLVIISLGISLIFFAYILGHIISYASHLIFSKMTSDKFFKNQKSIKKCRLCSELKRKYFNSEKIDEYKEALCRPHLNKIPLENKGIFLENNFSKISESIALRIADPYYSQMIYTTLVISGTFRAMTLIFAVYFVIFLIFFLSGTNKFFLYWWVPYILLILVLPFTIFLSFRIYCKYFRRYYELCNIVLVLKADRNKEDQ